MKTSMPLPFFADDRTVKHWDHGHTYTVACIDPNNRFTPESRPDFAAYLAHAANMYPELVEALQDFLGASDDDLDFNGPVNHRIRAVLAKCEEL